MRRIWITRAGTASPAHAAIWCTMWAWAMCSSSRGRAMRRAAQKNPVADDPELACTCCARAPGGSLQLIRWARRRTPCIVGHYENHNPGHSPWLHFAKSGSSESWGIPSALFHALTAARRCAGGTRRKTARFSPICWRCWQITTSIPGRCCGIRARPRATRTARRHIWSGLRLSCGTHAGAGPAGAAVPHCAAQPLHGGPE